MTLKTLASSLAVALSLTVAASFAQAESGTAAVADEAVQLQQIRNATVKISYGDTTFLIDPMLSKKGTYPGFENTYRSELRNPLVDLPMSVNEIIDGVDAVIVSHTHLDHWDDAAQAALPKDIPLFVQNLADALMIRDQGFTDVRILSKAEFNGVTLSQIGGQHGTDEMYAVPGVAASLGEAMGVVFQAEGQETLYLVGDTIWRDEVDLALADHAPQIVLINAGYAVMDGFDGSIIMGKDDVLRATQTAADATIVATHMDAINHMALTRGELRKFVQEKGIADRVEIPEDGATLNF